MSYKAETLQARARVRERRANRKQERKAEGHLPVDYDKPHGRDPFETQTLTFKSFSKPYPGETQQEKFYRWGFRPTPLLDAPGLWTRYRNE